ncbi:FAD synthase [Patescibacteria group bacterium]|nr:FAD synthase [Patescibacteria group bacterium]
MKKVIVFGTFDGIHEGHLNLFKQAKKYGDYLIVVVGRDENIKKLKGRYPLKNEQERLSNVRNQGIVGEAVLGGLSDPYEIISKINPNIIGLGYDQNSFTDDLEGRLRKLNLKVKIVRLKAYKPKIYHSSKLNK